MGYEPYVTLGVVALLFFSLVRNIAPPDILFLGAVALLASLKIITPEQALAGFANAGVITVAAMFIVAAALRETGVLSMISHRYLGKAKTDRAMLGRLAGLVVPLSAFLNNTPIVAMFVPVVLDWSRTHRVSPSRLLIPLSFFSILGGTCTLIGTSTNLVVQGLMLQNDLPGMKLFELAWVGVPYAIVGLIYLMTVGQKILPDRKELIEQLGEERREFLVEMEVQKQCRLIGQTVEAAGLRHLPGLFLIEIDRSGDTIGPVAPDQVIQEGDRLIFTGVVSSIIDLENIPGLVPATDPGYEVSPEEQKRRRLCEAVISQTSPLIGQTIRDADFRAIYGAAVVAVHRGGHRVKSKIGDIELQPGDTLLLQVRPHFVRAYRHDPAFYLVSNVDEWRSVRRHRSWVAILLFITLIGLMSTELLPIAVASMLIAFLMIAGGCLSSATARNSIEWQVLLTIAAAFGVGAALESSGAARLLAESLFSLTENYGPLMALALIYILGSLMTEVITNNAAAVLLFPFCLEIASLYNSDSRPFLMALVLSASASFMSPVGYQTNMMVYGPGGYRFSDFIKIGAPLNLILGVIAIILIPMIWPFQ